MAVSHPSGARGIAPKGIAFSSFVLSISNMIGKKLGNLAVLPYFLVAFTNAYKKLLTCCNVDEK